MLNLYSSMNSWGMVDVLWSVERVVQIEVLEVHGGKPGITLGENTVDEQFDKFN